MRGHNVHAKQLLGIDHVLGVGPVRGAGTLPGIAAIKQQRARALSADGLDQCRQVSKATNLAELIRRVHKVQIGERVRLGRAGQYAIVFQKGVAYQVRGIAFHGAYAQIDTWLAKVDGQQLRMAVGIVHERNVAKGWNLVGCTGSGGWFDSVVRGSGFIAFAGAEGHP